MSVSNTTVQAIYQGNGGDTMFAIPGDFQNNSEIRVVLRDEGVSPVTETLQVLTTDYTLTGGPPATDVTMVTAPSGTQKLLVTRQVAKTQPVDYIGTSEFPAESTETSLDKLTLIVQEICQKLTRAFLFKETTAETLLTTLQPIPDPESDQILTWNTAADALENKSATDIVALASFDDLVQGSATIVNNQVGATPIAGLSLAGTGKTSAQYFIEIDRPATSRLMATFMLHLQNYGGSYRAFIGGWEGDTDAGEPAGTTLTVTAAGAVEYESSNPAGGANGTIRWKRVAQA